MWCRAQVLVYGLSCLVELYCVHAQLSMQSWETANWLWTASLRLCWLLASFSGLCLNHFSPLCSLPSKNTVQPPGESAVLFLVDHKGESRSVPRIPLPVLPPSLCLWISSLLSLLSSFLSSFPFFLFCFLFLSLSLYFLVLFVRNLKYYSYTFHTVASHHCSINNNLVLVFKICLKHVWYFPSCYLHTEIMAVLYSLVSNGLLDTLLLFRWILNQILNTVKEYDYKNDVKITIKSISTYLCFN